MKSSIWDLKTIAKVSVLCDQLQRRDIHTHSHAPSGNAFQPLPFVKTDWRCTYSQQSICFVNKIKL